ncbi:hypothetical protein EYC80_001536 [Monilinia laxa]|uniref:Uncharacterized protein n=1 Tax=Monilinia laxa TaxID=61186 RepID=A0A5N6K594_MONLA|nr:hypothetical protein EYC80_001536 [Monilinia laxa]
MELPFQPNNTPLESHPLPNTTPQESNPLPNTDFVDDEEQMRIAVALSLGESVDEMTLNEPAKPETFKIYNTPCRFEELPGPNDEKLDGMSIQFNQISQEFEFWFWDNPLGFVNEADQEHAEYLISPPHFADMGYSTNGRSILSILDADCPVADTFYIEFQSDKEMHAFLDFFQQFLPDDALCRIHACNC